MFKVLHDLTCLSPPEELRALIDELRAEDAA